MTSKIIDYQTDDGDLSVDVRLGSENNTVWLTQKQMADLFETSRENVTMHIKNVFSERELLKSSVCKDFLHTASDGKKYNTKHYNLDVIISVGYRVKSKRGTQFRIWATRILRNHLMNGSSQVQKETVYIDNRQFHISVGDIRVEGSTFDILSNTVDLDRLLSGLQRLKTQSPDMISDYIDTQVSGIKNKDRSKWHSFIQDLVNEDSCFRRIVDASAETKAIVDQILALFK